MANGNGVFNKLAYGICGIFFGFFGVNSFIAGNIRMGIIKILFCWTFIPSIVGLIQGLLALCQPGDMLVQTGLFKFESVGGGSAGSKSGKNDFTSQIFDKFNNEISKLKGGLDAGLNVGLNLKSKAKPEEEPEEEPEIEQTVLVPFDAPSSSQEANDAFQRGKKYFNDRDYDNALNEFFEAIQYDSKFTAAYAYRGETYRMKGNYDLSVNDCTEAIRLDPKTLMAYQNRGAAYQALGKHDLAKKDFKKAVKIDPDNQFTKDRLEEVVGDTTASGRFEKGKKFYNNGNYANALEEFTQSISIDRKDPDVWIWRAWTYYNLGRFDMAISDSKVALEQRQKKPDSYLIMALSKIAIGRCSSDEVYSDFNQYIRLAPNDAMGYVHRGDFKRKGQYFKEAIEDFTEAIRINPNSAWAFRSRADANYWWGEGDKNMAFKDVSEAIRLNPPYADNYYFRAQIQQKLGNNIGAIKDLTEAIRLDPNNSDYYLQRADAYKKTGKRAEAIQDVRAILQINPDSQFVENINGVNVTSNMLTMLDKWVEDGFVTGIGNDDGETITTYYFENPGDAAMDANMEVDVSRAFFMIQKSSNSGGGYGGGPGGDWYN